MKKNTVLLLIISLLFSSCASLLNSRYQKVTINTQKGNVIKINDEVIKKKKGKYRLKRDLDTKTLLIQREGYRDERFAIMPYKKAPLYYLSWVPFGALVFPPFYDMGCKSYDHDKVINAQSRMAKIDEKEDKYKYVSLNKVSFDVSKDKIKYKEFKSYKSYRHQNETVQGEINEKADGVKFTNTVFTNILNASLHEAGYIDTTKQFFRARYNNTLHIDASITDFTLSVVNNRAFEGHVYEPFVVVDLVVEWNTLDYYKTSLVEQKTKVSSGEFRIGIEGKNYTEVLYNAIEDAIQFSFCELMSSKEVQGLLVEDFSVASEMDFSDINIPRAQAYVGSVQEAVDASVTLKVDEGHGSGFIISRDGYLVTNYHVIAGAENMKAILSDGSEHEIKVERVSKNYDLALLKIDTVIEKPFKINHNKKVVIGDEIYAIGTPTAQQFGQTVSRGIISGIRKLENNSSLIQTDASVNAGNSGGVLIDAKGNVQGIVTSKLNGYGVEGVAFAIPIDELIEHLKITLD